MSRTIDYFRNFFRSDKEKVRFRICDVLEGTLKLVEANFHELGLQIEVFPSEAEIIGHQNEFSQVLLNILINARDVCIDRKVNDPKILIRIFEEHKKGVITIADNAGGIPDEIMEKIFDPYFTTKGPDRGTGIGLYMAKTIIEKNMGGSLTASNTNLGAEFRIELDLSSEDTQPPMCY